MKYSQNKTNPLEFSIHFGGNCTITLDSKQFFKVLNADKPKKWPLDSSISIYPFYNIGTKRYDIIDFLYENKPKKSTTDFKDNNKYNLKFDNIRFITHDTKKIYENNNMLQNDNETQCKNDSYEHDNDGHANNSHVMNTILLPLEQYKSNFNDYVVLDKDKNDIPFYKIIKSHHCLKRDWCTNKLKDCSIEDKYKEVIAQWNHLEKYNKINPKYKMKKEGVFLPNYFTFQYPKNRQGTLCLEKDLCDDDGRKKTLNASLTLTNDPTNGKYEQSYIDQELLKLKKVIVNKYKGKLGEYNINIIELVDILM